MLDDDLSFWAAGHDGWRDEEADRAYDRRVRSASWQARTLRAYTAEKIGVPMPTVGRYLHEVVQLLDANLIAVANAATEDLIQEIMSLSACGENTIHRRLERLREQGRTLLASYRDLQLDRPEGGPPRGLEPVALPMTVDSLEKLVDEVLKGAVDLSRLPHHLWYAILAVLERRQKELRKRHEMASKIVPPVSLSPDEVVSDFLSSPEWQMIMAAISAVQSVIEAALIPAVSL